MGDGTVPERYVAAMDALQPSRTVPLEDLFDDDMPWYSLGVTLHYVSLPDFPVTFRKKIDMLWYSFWADVDGGWLETDTINEVRNHELN